MNAEQSVGVLTRKTFLSQSTYTDELAPLLMHVLSRRRNLRQRLFGLASLWFVSTLSGRQVLVASRLPQTLGVSNSVQNGLAVLRDALFAEAVNTRQGVDVLRPCSYKVI